LEAISVPAGDAGTIEPGQWNLSETGGMLKGLTVWGQITPPTGRIDQASAGE